MAYKFQLGSAVLSGSVTFKQSPEMSAGLNLSEQNIINVGQISADVIQPDAGAVGLDIQMEGNDGLNKISLTDNLSDALNINQGGTSYLKFTTTDGQEMITAGKTVMIDGSTNIMFRDTDIGINSDNDGKLRLLADSEVHTYVDGATRVSVTSAGASVTGVLSASSNLQVGGTVRLDGAADASFDVGADSLYFMDGDALVKKDAFSDIVGSAIAAQGGLATVPGSGQFRLSGSNMQAGVVSLADDEIAFIDADGSVKREAIADFMGLVAGTVTSTGLSDSNGVLKLDINNLNADTSVADSNLVVVDTGGGTLVKMTRANFIESAALDAINIDGGAIDGVTLGTNSAVTNSNFSILTASHAQITNLDVVTINSVSQTETTLEISDKLIVAALSASSANSAGGGIKIGGGAEATGHASILWDHGNSALDFNIGGTTEIRLADGVLRPESDNDVDLGASGAEFKDLYIDGTAYLDAIDFNGTAISATAAEINYLDNDDLTAADITKLAAIDATAAEINLLDSGAGSSVALVGGDGVLMFDASDSNDCKKVLMSDIKTFIGAGVEAVASGSDGVVLSEGLNYFGDHGGAISATMLDSSTAGTKVRIKAGSDCSSTNTLTISMQAANTVDGASSIILESPFAAVECVLIASGSWRVF